MAAAVDPDVFTARQVVPSMAKDLIVDALMADIMVMLSGAPGIGKSSIIHAIAEEYNLKVIDLRLAQCDPTDLNGFPTFDKDTGRARYAPMDTFPLEGDPLPINPITGEPYDGWILFLDEFNSADRAVQKAAYRLCLDHQVGLCNLHPNCKIVGAGNRLQDNAIVEELSSALQSRMIHLELLSCPTEWIPYAHGAGFAWQVVTYIEEHNAKLNEFDPSSDSGEPTYPCERTWDFVSRFIKKAKLDLDGEKAVPLISATIGEGPARDFLNWVAVYKDLPKWGEILSNPKTAKLPDTPGRFFAMCGMISGNASDDTLEDAVTYLERLPKEYQVVTIRNMGIRSPTLLGHTAVADWMLEHGQELY